MEPLKCVGDKIDEKVKQSTYVDFSNAVQEAAGEVGRLLSMKLSRSESESTLLLGKNSGIKEGVVVPETSIDRLLYSQSEPVELLPHYSSKGCKLPDFMDTQLVPRIGNSLLDETIVVETSKSTTVEESMEAESLTVSREVKATQTSTVVVVMQYPPVYMGRFCDSANYQTKEDDGKKATIADVSAPSGMNGRMGDQKGSLKVVTWEVVATIKDQFLNYNLGDKVVSVVADNDMTMRVSLVLHLTFVLGCVSKISYLISNLPCSPGEGCSCCTKYRNHIAPPSSSFYIFTPSYKAKIWDIDVRFISPPPTPSMYLSTLPTKDLAFVVQDS
ncbi:hypothetical protein V8G54_033882 [Vigna mungo]|uniref:Uncharacterized protein n=1 Tax=Vigna mungo TaxID=3915 RepID=A0AAQ3MNQ2_VIGMU